jgi:glycosyltransferase involved in cell wall biosynthesis
LVLNLVEKSMNILFIGAGYFPFLTAGEKNFFYRLIPILNEHAEITVASLNDYPEPVLTQKSEQKSSQVYCLKRPFHRNYERFFFNKENYIAYHHRHKPPREILEKLVSIIFHTPTLGGIIRKHNIQVLHFMDNFGPSMPYMKNIFRNVKVTYSAANYDPRGRKGRYDQYLRMSLNSLDAIGVYTEAYRNILLRIGLKNPQYLTRWGVSPIRSHLSQEEKQQIKASLGINSDATFLLWSGYLQQIQEDDFYQAVDAARKVVNHRDNIIFMFAFKPETYKEKYGAEESEQIKIISGLTNFGDVLESADFLYSPIADSSSTVSPPLTWIESMAKGTPIITTKIPGVEELIENGVDGLIAENYGELSNLLGDLDTRFDLKSISLNSTQKVEQEFNINKSAEAYLGMWRSVLNHG